MSDFLAYCEALGWTWLAIVTGVVLVLPDLSDKIWPDWKAAADRAGFKPPIRRRLEVALLVLIVVWAGYSAWHTERDNNANLQKQLNEALHHSDHSVRQEDDHARSSTPSPVLNTQPIIQQAKHDHNRRPPSVDAPVLGTSTHEMAGTVVQASPPTNPVAAPPQSPYQAPAPRSLTVDQEKVLVAALAPLSEQVERSQIGYVFLDNESFQLAKQFHRVFQLAGLKPELTPETQKTPDELGLMIEQGINTPKPLLATVKANLEHVGLKPKIIKRDFAGIHQIYIFVGAQPL